ncbi:MAG: hypothetical protein M0Q38_11745 [Bacteroidales bacterium]|jgi:hypothetical protein|nr:hypothetical protein [Bacteroidales bacterium]
MTGKKSLSIGERCYRIFRKIHFLAKRGSLFSFRRTTIIRGKNYPKRTFTIIFFNSTLLFILANLLVFVITRLSTGIAALSFNINTISYYYDINYLITGDKWTADAVQAVFSTGPIIALFTGIVLFFLYVSVQAETGILRLLVLWMIAQSIVFFLGEMLMGALFNQGFGYVIMYLFVMDTGKMLISVFAMVAMVTLGFFFTRLFLFSGNIYFNCINAHNRRKFVLNQFIYPFIAGNLLIFIIKIPELSLYEMCTNATMIFILLPVSIRGMNTQEIYFDEDPRSLKFSGTLIAITFLSLVLYRVIFGIGVRL